MKWTIKRLGLIALLAILSSILVGRIVFAQNTVRIITYIDSVDVHTRLDPRRSPTAELYSKVKLPGYNWIQSSVLVGDHLTPGAIWDVSRYVQSSNRYSVGFEIWDEDGRGGQRDDRGFAAWLNNIEPEECRYTINSEKAIHYGTHPFDTVCSIQRRLPGSHLDATIALDIFY